VKSQANEIATFFGEETPINQIFGLFSEFISSFTKSKENLSKKLLIERRKAIALIRSSVYAFVTSPATENDSSLCENG
jgi:hypothetical protein